MSESEPRVVASAHVAAVTDVLVAVRALSDAMDRMHGSMRGGMEMNASDLAALRMMIIREQRGEPVTPADLARHLRISTASTTKLVDRMEAAGHVRRRPHPHDRRARVLELTDHSRASFQQHFRASLTAMRGVADTYSREELDLISQFLLRLAAAIDPEH